jgi:O-antigen ligase
MEPQRRRLPDIQATPPPSTLTSSGALSAAPPAVQRLEIPPQTIVLAALGAAFIVGVALAQGVPLGLAALIAFCWAPLVLLNLPLAIVLWTPLVFLHDITALRFGPQLASMIILLAWIGTLLDPSSPARELLAAQRRYLVPIAAFVLWITLSVAWSDQSALAGDIWFAWLQAALLFLVIVTTFLGEDHLRMLIAAFVIGAVIAVLIGLLSTGLTSSDTALDTATGGRLVGGSGDPNYLAAGIIPAAILAAGLAAATPSSLVRVGVAMVIGVLTIGFVGSQSRGGLVAAVLASFAALAVFKRGRTAVLLLLLVVTAVGSAWYSANPDAWERISSFDGSGTGRTELWEIAWQMGGDQPIAGVGLDNFVVRSPSYADQAGPLEHAGFIAEVPHVAHNVYLQLFAETGVVGLALFLVVAVAAMRAAMAAARRFDANGNPGMGTLSRSVFVAQIAMLAASFFLSNGHDRRTWILLALGPALLAAASKAMHSERRYEGLQEGGDPEGPLLAARR